MEFLQFRAVFFQSSTKTKVLIGFGHSSVCLDPFEGVVSPRTFGFFGFSADLSFFSDRFLGGWGIFWNFCSFEPFFSKPYYNQGFNWIWSSFFWDPLERALGFGTFFRNFCSSEFFLCH